MVSIGEAQRIILQHIPLLATEEVRLVEGLGRIIGADVRAPWDIPAADNSAMDGYAFASGTLRGDILSVAGFLPAGLARTKPVAAGEAVRIMTGAPIPPGCDTVVPIEEVEETGGAIRLMGDVRPGSHVRRRGEEIREGELAIAAGSPLRPQEIGMLASLGMGTARVFRRPRVGVLATGDEVLEPGSPLAPGKIINSNSYSIAAQIVEAGGEPVMLGIVGDDREATRDKIVAGLAADLLVTTGGVSVGDRDYLKDVLIELGGEIKFWKVNMKPGKPFAFAVVGGKPVFALPGNPVAAMMTFELFARPAMLRMSGHTRIFRPVVAAHLLEPLRNKADRPQLVRCRVTIENGRYAMSVTGNQSSARLSSLTEGNGFAALAPGATFAPGDEVAVSLLDRSFEMGEAAYAP